MNKQRKLRPYQYLMATECGVEIVHKRHFRLWDYNAIPEGYWTSEPPELGPHGASTTTNQVEAMILNNDDNGYLLPDDADHAESCGWRIDWLAEDEQMRQSGVAELPF